MKFSEFLTSAVNSIASIPPARAAAGVSAAVSFVMAFVLLPNANSNAPAGSRQTITVAGALISAFLASQLAAYILRIVERRPSWLDRSPAQKLGIVLVLALVSAAFVLGLMLLVS
ncbi:MAG TPA: hypothetical protein VLE70_21490 [Anaerolineae bacterium]|jgi:uncharacterized membrane protein required for colicin V production|nr:hypothetical protein [Anaerolineae bacterium]